MQRSLTLFYAIACYLVFLATFLYLIGFTGGLVVPRGVDDGAVSPWPWALACNAGLIALFGLQHSVMARAGFKRIWTRLIPGPAERSTYVLMANVTLILLFVLWQPLPATVWHADAQWLRVLLWSGFFAGWGIVLISTFLIDHFDLFGLRQVWNHFRRRRGRAIAFATPGPYKRVRHPMMTGFLLGFWSTPEMSAGHLLLALGMSAYIVAGTTVEERGLIAAFGERYRRYRRVVPRFVPVPGRRFADETSLTRAFRAHGVSVDRLTAFGGTKAFYRAGGAE